MTHAGGRPPKFKDIEELDELLSRYFQVCKDDKKIPTKAGMALYLDTTRETLGDYEGKEEFSYTIKRAYQLIEEAWNQKLGGNTQVAGSIFYLKNAFHKDYKDKQEVDTTIKGSISLTDLFDKSRNDNT